MHQINENKAYERSGKIFLRKELVFGIGTTLIFFFSLLLAPLAGIFSSLLSPLPTLLGFYRWGRPEGYAIPAGAALVGGLILSYLGLIRVMGYLLELLLLGLLLGDGMRRQWSIERTIGRAALIAFTIGALIFWFTHGGPGSPVFKNLEENVLTTAKEVFHQYNDLFPEKYIPMDQFRQIVAVMIRLLPGFALASTLFVAWLNLLLARRFCRIHRLPLPAWQEWSHWKSPDLLVWPVIACGFVLLLPSPFLLQILSLNILMVLGAIYLFQGLAVVVFYFQRWKLSPFFRGILYAVIFLQQIVTLGVVFLGLFDVWFDFRRLSGQKNIPNP